MPEIGVGTVWDGYQNPCFPLVLDLVGVMQLRLPSFNLIGWDMSVGKDGRPALIEWNRAAELSKLLMARFWGNLLKKSFMRL